MKMKNKNCRYYLNPWNKTAFKLSLASENCYITYFNKEMKQNNRIQENLKF